MLNPDNIDQVILCTACNQQLWRMKVLSRFGDRVGGVQYTPIGHKTVFHNALRSCPKCTRQFYREDPTNKEHIYRLADPQTGRVIEV